MTTSQQCICLIGTVNVGEVRTELEAATRIGIRHATRQCEELLRQGAPGVHFYTLNKSRATQAILEHLRAFRTDQADYLKWINQ